MTHIESDVTNHVTSLPDNRWAAWDDRELAIDRVSFFRSRSEAMEYDAASWREVTDVEEER